MAEKVDLEPLREFIRREFLFDPDAELSDDAPLFPDVVDSLGVMEVVGFVEQEYGVAIDDSEMLVENFRSVGAIGSLIGRQGDGA